MKLKIFTKIMLPSILIILLLGISMPLIAFKTIKDQYISSFIDNLKNITFLLRPQITEFFENKKTNELDGFLKSLKQNMNLRITVIDNHGMVLADSEKDPKTMENHKLRPEFIDAISSGMGKSLRYSITVEERMLYVAVPIVSDAKVLGVLRVSTYLKNIEILLDYIKREVFWLIITMVCIAIVITLIVSRGISRSIKELLSAAKELSLGKFNVQVFLKTDDELKELADAFNEMAKKMEKMFLDLSRQKEEFNTIISSIEEPLLVLKKNGVVKLCNESFKKIADNKEIKGGYFWEYLRSPELDDLVKKVKAEKNNLVTELKIKNNFYISSFTFLNQTDEIILVLHDITKFKQIENLKKDFIANISHELRTPLTAIKGFIETLEEEEHIKNVYYLEAIKRHTNRLMNIVNDLLSLSELESANIRLEYEEVDINYLLDNIIKIFEQRIKEKGLNLKMEIQKELKPIYVDPFKIEQMVINLIDNAVKFTEKGYIQISVRQDEKNTMIEVEDTGIGIPESSIPSIFERFYTVDKSRSKKLGGTGLGLSIVKHIVQLHKGKIDVQSRYGRGTKFTVTLPNE